MHIKICGLTTLDDARVALAAGADLLGFNFYRPSPRYIAPQRAAQIIATLRAEFASQSFCCVGVFVNSPVAEIQQVRAQCGLDLIQLHGDESAEFCLALKPYAFKALRPQSAEEAERFVTDFAPLSQQGRGVGGEGVPRFLIDASHPHLYGGTGATGDWHIARSIAQQFPILLAGGLSAANVAQAVHSVRPWGVDVASGVERAPGLKDAEKVRQFMEAVRNI